MHRYAPQDLLRIKINLLWRVEFVTIVNPGLRPGAIKIKPLSGLTTMYQVKNCMSSYLSIGRQTCLSNPSVCSMLCATKSSRIKIKLLWRVGTRVDNNPALKVRLLKLNPYRG